MQKITRAMAVLAVLLITAAMLSVPAAAIAGGFSVTPVLPDNQRVHRGNSFFDLLVTPGQVQELTINVHNTTGREILVTVDLFTPSTNQNGDINYTSRGLLDETLRHSFEDIARGPEGFVVIPPGFGDDATQIPITLTVPNEPFEGVILGSIHVLREPTQEEIDAAGEILHLYAAVTAVQLVLSEDAVESVPVEFVLGDNISLDLVNYMSTIVVPIRNPHPRIIRYAQVNAQIFQRGNRNPIFDYEMTHVEFAPNSIFPLSFVDHQGFSILPGDYTAVIAIDFEGTVWNFEKSFTIDEQTAAQVTEGAVNLVPEGMRQQQPAAVGGIPIWGMVIGGMLLLILIILLIAILKAKMAPPVVVAMPEFLNDPDKEQK